jgi:hypothetical protein
MRQLHIAVCTKQYLARHVLPKGKYPVKHEIYLVIVSSWEENVSDLSVIFWFDQHGQKVSVFQTSLGSRCLDLACQSGQKATDQEIDTTLFNCDIDYNISIYG